MSYLTLKCILNFQIAAYLILNLCVSLADTFSKSKTMIRLGYYCDSIYGLRFSTYAASSYFKLSYLIYPYLYKII
jgi:hypothetical protein